LERLFGRKENLITQLNRLKSSRWIDNKKIMELQDELDTVNNNIGELCAERNRSKVKEFLKDDENIDGGIQSKIWELKKNCYPII